MLNMPYCFSERFEAVCVCVCGWCRLFKAEEMMVQDLLQWSVADVVSYFTSVGFPEQAVAFRMQVSLSSVQNKTSGSELLLEHNILLHHNNIPECLSHSI